MPFRRSIQYRLPGPVRLAQPAHDGVRHRRRAADHPRHRRRRSTGARWCSELMRLRRPRRPLSRPLSAQLLRRAAPADRHRPRAGAAAGAADLRRAGLGARRLGAGADPQPAEGPAGGARPDLPVHLAQPRGRRLHGRPHRGDVRRPHRRGGAARGAVPPPGASLYACAAGGGALPRPRPAARLLGADGRPRLDTRPPGRAPFTASTAIDAAGPVRSGRRAFRARRRQADPPSAYAR